MKTNTEIADGKSQIAEVGALEPHVEIANSRSPIANSQIPNAVEGQSSKQSEKGMKGRGGEELLDEMAGVLRRFVVLPRWGAETLALWSLHTYAFELREVTAYVGIESPEKRCGKTTLLGVLSELVNRPVVSANISPSAFFRVIEELQPTLLIDEADTFVQGNEELRGVLNAGYSRKTAYVIRMQNSEGRRQKSECRIQKSGVRGQSRMQNEQFTSGMQNDASSPLPSPPEEEREEFGSSLLKDVGRERFGNSANRLARFSCWCPKAMAAIGRLPETLADRCILIRMERKRADDCCERLRNLETSALRERCERFVEEHAEEIRMARPELPKELNDRAADIWEPLLALADLAGGEWPGRAREAAVALTARAQENSPIGGLLFDMFRAFMRKKPVREKMLSRDLVNWLNRFKDRPWREGVKEVTEIWLAQQLRPYGVTPRNIRAGEQVGKGYVRAEVLEVCRRYIPGSEVEEWRKEWEERKKAEVRGQKAEVRNPKSEIGMMNESKELC